MNNKCVYQLIDKNNEIRYIGQGSLDRPHKRNNRSKDYLDILDDGGMVEIVSTNLTRIESLKIEHDLIQKHKLKLVNKVSSPVINKLVYEELNSLFEISEISPSGLIW